MGDELAKKLAEAKAKMFGDLQPSGGKTLLLVSGEGRIESNDKKLDIQKVTR